MEEKILLVYEDIKNIERSAEMLNKLETAQKILELLETKEVIKIELIYNKKEPATTSSEYDEIIIKDKSFQFDKDGMKIRENVNYSLDDLKQKVINYLMNKETYNDEDNAILKILFQ